ncbi:MAG: DUF1460 domain-containing protein [Muribaculaceae bacterium]|nr:DUF1460 domain-containing protein [Muribaculaceae bacterium]
MKKYRLSFLSCILMLTFALSFAGEASAAMPSGEVDTVKIMNIIEMNYTPGGDPTRLVGKVAESFVGTPAEEVTMEDTTGDLNMRTDAFDDMSFLNTVVALARLSTSPGHKRINEYADELRNITYRRGNEDGFASKMVYVSDWIVDNKSRNNVTELTENYSDQFRTKSLEKVTRERSRYAALKDSAAYEAQKMVEMGYRTHKIPHLKREYAAYKDVKDNLKDGDIVIILSPEPSTDALEIGVLREREDGFHLIHPSKTEGKVVEEPEVLDRYLKRNAKRTYGWRWLRLKQ